MIEKNRRGAPRAHRRLHPEQGYGEKLPSYFVPSFSVRHHIAVEDEQQATQLSRHVASVTGRAFHAMPPPELTVKLINQGAFISSIRRAEVNISPDTVLDMAFLLRDRLLALFQKAPTHLAFPLGRIASFGSDDKALGLAMLGWRGFTARYETADANDALTPHASVLYAGQVCVDTIAEVMERETGQPFSTQGLARSPHLTVAHKTKGILRDHEVRRLETPLQNGMPEELLLGDPVIALRLAQNTPYKPLYVRHGYRSIVPFED